MSRISPSVVEEQGGAPRARRGRRTSYASRTPAGRWIRRALAATALVGVVGCSALQLYSTDDDMQLGLQAYEEILAQERILESGPEVDMVQRVTARLVESAKRIGPEFTHDFEWEVRVIDNPEVVNAFCLPGGKMAVYTGILPVAQSDTGLAVVMGHEIAHATERHGTERMSRATIEAMLVEAGVAAAGGDEMHAAAAHGVLQVAVNLPYSRSDELEADEVGLMIMAGAGYDPREAAEFWGRMAALSGGGGSAIDEFLSTHPTDGARIAQIEELLPEALALYDASQAPKNP